MGGNIGRCTGYQPIIRAIEAVSAGGGADAVSGEPKTAEVTR